MGGGHRPGARSPSPLPPWGDGVAAVPAVAVGLPLPSFATSPLFWVSSPITGMVVLTELCHPHALVIAVEAQPRLSKDFTTPECVIQLTDPIPAAFPVRKWTQRGGSLAQGYSFIQQILIEYLPKYCARSWDYSCVKGRAIFW